jgi:two-component system, cell cycle response regulator DivK
MASELILIVEDNEKNRKLIRDVLQVKGYQTLETETAEEGHILAVEKHPPSSLGISSFPVWTELRLSSSFEPIPKQRPSLLLPSRHQL